MPWMGSEESHHLPWTAAQTIKTKLCVLLLNIMFSLRKMLTSCYRVSAILFSKAHNASVPLLVIFIKCFRITIKASSYPVHRKHETVDDLVGARLTATALITMSRRFPFRGSSSPTLRVISMRGGGGWIIPLFIQVHLIQSVSMSFILCDLSM